MRRSPALSALFTVALMTIVAVLSLTPDHEDPRDSTFEWLVHVTPTLAQKLMHVVCYGLIATGWWTTLRATRSTNVRVATAFLIATGYGASMEWLQAYVPGRFGSVYDIALNALGAAIALTAARFVERRSRARAR